MVFTGEFYQNFKEQLSPIQYNIFQKLEEWITHRLFYEANFIQILKPGRKYKGKHTQKQLWTKTYMNIFVQIINIILTVRNHHYIKWFMYHDKRDFILGIQDWFSIQKSIHKINSIYKLRKKKIKLLYIVEIVLYKIQLSFMIKILRKSRNRRELS